MQRIVGFLIVCTLAAVAGYSSAEGRKLGVTKAQNAAVMKGWSATKDLLNKSVENEKGELLGRIDDIVVTTDRGLTVVILGAGGLSGLEKHDVAIPTSQLKFRDGKFVLPGVSKDQVKALPEFEYQSSPSRKEKSTSVTP